MKIRHYYLTFVTAACSLFGLVFQINAMMPYGTSLGMRKSRDKIEQEKKENQERKKQIEQALKDSKEENAIHIYDQSLAHHRVLSKDLWSKVGVFKLMMENLSETGDKLSQVQFLDVSDKTINSIWLLLDNCQGISKEDDAFCVRVEAGLRDFDTLVSIADFMQHYDVEPSITNQFVKNFQQRLMDFFNGKSVLTQENVSVLNKANADLQKIVLATPWNIYLEKMRLHIAKSGKLDSNPEFFSRGMYGRHIKNIIFSPDEKYVLMLPDASTHQKIRGDARVLFPHPMVLNRDGTVYWELSEAGFAVIWINSTKFVYQVRPRTLGIADNTAKKSQIIEFNATVQDIQKIMIYKGRILFSYKDDQNKLNIGMYDQESGSTTYKLLSDISDDILCVDKKERLLFYDKNKKIVYRLKNFYQ